MKIRIYRYILPILLFAGTYTLASEFPGQFKLLPLPQKIEFFNQKGLRHTDVRGLYVDSVSNRPVMRGLLADLPLMDSTADGVIALIINPKLNLPSTEGYVLVIRNKKVTVQALSKAGLFYGIQTLSQLLEDAQDQQIEIPSCRITDYPEIAYRAVHLDLKHHLDAGHYYYSMIDKLASIKVNAIIIEFEDKLGYRKSPLVASPNAISIEEFAAISQYARDRYIEISPLVQGLGHASFILKHEAYKTLRDDPKSDWVFDPLNPGTYDLQFSLYEDAMAATPYGKYLHVGGDEVGKLGASSLSKASGMSALQLQLYWLNKVAEFARQHNRIPIFWDDMLFKLADLYPTTYTSSMPVEVVNEQWKKNEPQLSKSLSLFPKGCVFMRWNYSHPLIPGNQKAIDWYNANGLTAMAATSAQLYSSMFPQTGQQFQPIKEFCQLTSKKKMSGILCTIWDDTSPHRELLWQGVYDFGFFSWNYEDVSSEVVHSTYRQRFYASALAKPAYNFQDKLEAITPFWETAFLQKGDREIYHKTFLLMALPGADRGTWTRDNKAKLTTATAARQTYKEIADQLKIAQKLTRRNQYSLSLFQVVTNLQAYSSDLLLLLERYDLAKGKRTSEALLIKNKIESFGIIKAQFEEAYAKTRIMNNPENYILDSNFHEHLANGINTPDWMVRYELAFNKKALEWLASAHE